MDITRRSLHAVAELLLAGPQFRTSGTIRLAVSPTGFATVKPPSLRVDGGFFVFGHHQLPLHGRTPRALAVACGLDAGAPEGLYHDHAELGLDDVLHVDLTDAALLYRCWSTGAAAMERLGTGETPVLWPEHFDVGVYSGHTGYGVSPGDGFLNEPYAYVTTATPPAGDPFWNAPFGAARPASDLDEDAVHAFFAEGRERGEALPG